MRDMALGGSSSFDALTLAELASVDPRLAVVAQELDRVENGGNGNQRVDEGEYDRFDEADKVGYMTALGRVRFPPGLIGEAAPGAGATSRRL